MSSTTRDKRYKTFLVVIYIADKQELEQADKTVSFNIF
jgi:HD superfamily phosphohydrolase YqeK